MRRVFESAWVFVAASCFVAGFGIAIRPSTALAQAESLDRAAWIGVKVMPKLNAQVKADGGVIDERKLSLPFLVQDVKDDLLYVGGHDKGWIGRSEVVKLDEAAAYYTSFIERREQLPWAYDCRAITLALLDKPDLSIADANEELRIEPSARAYCRRGEAWADQQEFDKAVVDFNEAIRVDPNDARAHTDRGLAWAEKKECDKAIDDLNESIRLDPNNAIAYGKRGAVWAYKQEYGKALEDIDLAIRLDPNDAMAYSARGAVWAYKHEYDKALVDLSEAIRLDPHDANAYICRGGVWAFKQEYDKAITDLNQAIQLDPKDAAAYCNRGAAWLYKKDYDKAIDDLNKAIQLNPDKAMAYNNRGCVWLRKREPDKAIADFNQLIRLDQDHAGIYFNRGQAWTLKGEYEKAITDYNEAFRIDSNARPVYQAAAWLRATCPEARFRNGKKAVNLATKACELSNWRNCASFHVLAAACAESRDFESAVKWQQKAVDLSQDDAEYVKEANERLALYRRRQPYREPGGAPAVSVRTRRSPQNSGRK